MSFRTVALWVIPLFLFLALFQYFSSEHRDDILSGPALLSAAEAHEVSRVDVTPEGGTGTGRVSMRDGTRYGTPALPLEDFTELQKHGVAVVFSDSKGWETVLSQFLPVVVLVGLFIFFLRHLQGKSSQVLDFQVTPQRVTQPPALEGLADARARLKAAAEAARDGVAGPRRILLVGPPGTGKTSLLRAAAADSGLPLIAFPGSTFVEVFVGVGAARIRTLFKRAAETSPVIVAIDDVDAFATRRVLPQTPGTVDERAATLLELTNRLDGLSPFPARVLFIATTSRPEFLDEALTRPGRFELSLTLAPGGQSTAQELTRPVGVTN
ncbi:MAG: AAA family ATPase [Myxococcota bacterium]